jgi:hypothetical protein
MPASGSSGRCASWEDGEPAAAGQLPPVGGRVPRRDAVLGGEAGAAHLAGFGYRDDGCAIGVAADPPGVPGAALTCPDDDDRDRCQRSDLPCRRVAQYIASVF